MVLFTVGEYISYPMHGAGVIEAIEDREIDGAVCSYYVLRFYEEGIKIMVPVDKAEQAGLRSVIERSEIPQVMGRLTAEEPAEDANWNKRYRQNLDKLRDGDIYTTAEVVGTLSQRMARRGLSAGEKKMLINARRFMLGELIFSSGGSREEFEQLIDRTIEAAR